MRKILIVGACSAIAEETARIFAERGDKLYLAARNIARLQILADDLRVRGAVGVGFSQLDVNDFDAHGLLIEKAQAAMSGLDTLLVAHGTLSDQVACQSSVERTLFELKTNALSTVSLLTLVANHFERQKNGTIIVISSVAGDRGRQSNYVYGSAKAMVTAFLSGLMQRLAKSNVSVITIKPGFVDTPMTARFRKGVLWAKPSGIAKGIIRAVDQKKSTCYLPGFWHPIMLAVRCLPDSIFKRLPL